MSKSSTFSTDVLKKVFNNTEFDWLPLTDFYLSLHTDDPGAGGNQTTNECNYMGYSRMAIPRTSTNWTVSGNQVQNNVLVKFPTCVGGFNLAKYFSIGTSATGSGKIIYSGKLTSTVTVGSNFQPRFSIGSITTLES